MKAAFFEEYGELKQIKVGELDKPVPEEGEVLIRVKSAGVNPVDAAVARGMLKDAIPAEFPAIPGWDVAGEIVDRGYSARRFNVGDHVYAYARRPVIQHGTFSEFVALPESYVAKSPDSLSMEQAGAIPLTGLTAYQSLLDVGEVRKGDCVLILGASGGVGSFAIQLAKWKGAEVIGVAGTSNQDYMKELGADHVIDYSDGDVGAAVDAIASEGVDLIFHCSRGDSLHQSHNRLKKNGRLISITNRNPERRDDVRFNYVFVEPNAVQLEHLSELVDKGFLSVLITKSYQLDECRQALQDIESLHTTGKTVILP